MGYRQDLSGAVVGASRRAMDSWVRQAVPAILPGFIKLV